MNNKSHLLIQFFYADLIIFVEHTEIEKELKEPLFLKIYPKSQHCTRILAAQPLQEYLPF